MEIWKAINGYQGLYEISNYGRVKALAKVIQRETKQGLNHYYKEQKILTGTIDGKGYYHVRLTKNKVKTLFKIHNLVVTHFMRQLEENEVIHHIDFNKQNNNISNLTILDKFYHIKMHNLSKKKGVFYMPERKAKRPFICIETRTIVFISSSSS